MTATWSCCCQHVRAVSLTVKHLDPSSPLENTQLNHLLSLGSGREALALSLPPPFPPPLCDNMHYMHCLCPQKEGDISQVTDTMKPTTSRFSK